MGNSTFSNCKALTEIKFPQTGTVELDSWAFGYCDELPAITLYNANVSPNAFQSCGKLETVTINGSVELKKEALYGLKTLSTVNFGTNEKITSIGNMAFSYSGLKSLTLPEGIEKIGERAFYGCSITNVALPAKLVTISDKAFAECKSLKSLAIPASTATISNTFAAGCTSLASITVDSANPNFKAVDNVLFTKGDFLLYYAPARTGENYVNSDSATGMQHYSFGDTVNLKKLTIARNITQRDLAHAFCSGVETNTPFPKDTAFCTMFVKSDMAPDGIDFENGDRLFIALYKGDTLVKVFTRDSITASSEYDYVDETTNAPLLSWYIYGVECDYDRAQLMVWNINTMYPITGVITPISMP